MSLLPSTLLMLVLSARAGALAQRIGPRWLMTVGPLITATGLLLATRIGPGASYLADVLPAVSLFGLGMSATVAPLTATMLASADVRHAGVASGVNNAVARAAGLLAVAGLPLAVGLTGESYRNPVLLESGFQAAMVICAALLVAAAALSALTIDNHVLRAEPTITGGRAGVPHLLPGRRAAAGARQRHRAGNGASPVRGHRLTGLSGPGSSKLGVCCPAGGGKPAVTTRKPEPMRWSQMHIPTLREDPADAGAPSHRLLLRAGYIRQLMAGHYSLLPLAVRVRAKVIEIIRQEMNQIGAQEVLLPTMHPAEIWQRSGRWEVMGEEMFRLKDRKGAPTGAGHDARGDLRRPGPGAELPHGSCRRPGTSSRPSCGTSPGRGRDCCGCASSP